MIRLLALWMGFTSMAGARAYVGSDEEVGVGEIIFSCCFIKITLASVLEPCFQD